MSSERGSGRSASNGHGQSAYVESRRAERRERERWDREQAQAARERWERAQQSEREPQAPHERGESPERDHQHVVLARSGAVLMAGLVAAILVGLAAGIFNRTDDTLPDHTPQSAAGIEREAPTAQASNPARQVSVPRGASRATGSGSPPPRSPSGASVRIGTVIPSGRGAQSAIDVEHGAPARQPQGTATDRPPVGRNRAPEYASTVPSLAPGPTNAPVGDATVGRHAVSPSDRGDLAPPVANASEFFTRGSYYHEVARVQGAPTEIDAFPASDYETWRYGLDTVRISTRSRQVIEWSNHTGNLKVR